VDHKAPRTRVLLNQFGGRFGGPIWIPKVINGHDKAFFFVNYEEYRLPERTSRARTLLTQPASQGIFRYITAAGATQSVNLLTLAGSSGLPSTIDPTIGSLLTDMRGTRTQGGVQQVAGQ